MELLDTVIRNGRVLDPANGLDVWGLDLGIKDGKIVRSSNQQVSASSSEEFDATGCYVVPGLIDSHVHVYQHCTTLGVDPDETCLKRGIIIISILSHWLLKWVVLGIVF